MRTVAAEAVTAYPVSIQSSMRKLSYLLLLAASVAPAQKIYLYPSQVTAPRGSFQTFTAIVNGVNDKTVSWKASGGSLVGGNPCIVNEPCTIALYSATPGTFHIQAVSDANRSVSAEAMVTFTPAPQPVSSHPRLLVTAAMLPGLRAKATNNNVIYQSIKTRGEQALSRDNPLWSWSCRNGSGQPSSDQSGAWKEGDANLFAFLSMVAPTPAERNTWGCYGRDVWVYVMNQVLAQKEALGGNHWSDSAAQLTLTTDWLLAGGYLSTNDQALARRFLAFATKQILALSYGITPAPTGYNSSSQFDANKPDDLADMRAMGNNYTMSRALYLAAASLTFNDTPADDPGGPNSCNATRYQVCSDYSAGSLHAYWAYFTGSMLYRLYAHLEDPDVSWRAYQQAYSNLPNKPTCLYVEGSRVPCFGDGRGGESSEGSWYQYSQFRLRYALNLIHTAGYDDPLKYGPQISLGTSSWWDLKYVSDISFLTGQGKSGPNITPAYNYLTTGDSYQYFRQPSDFITEASMLAFDSYTGRKDRNEPLKWLILNTALGGPAGKDGGCTTYCGFDAELTNDFASPVAMDMMIAMPASDPVSLLPADPRPGLPTDLFNGSFNLHAMLRTTTNTGRVLFSTYCPNALIDHEHEFCGRFDIFSNGEYITKGRTEFNDYNNRMSSATQSNTLSIVNTNGSKCPNLDCMMYNAVVDGGQFWHAQQQGFNLITHAELPGYAAFLFNDTPAYNGWWAYHHPYDVASYSDVTKASRSLVYLRSADEIVFYDRGATAHGSPKAVYQVTTGTPNISGNTATWLTRSGSQKAFLVSLLPHNATVAKADLIAGGVDQKNDWEPASSIRISAGSQQETHFLSVLEWGNSSFAGIPASLVQSAAGQPFEGARVGASLVMFMRDWPASLTNFTYPASGATTQYVSDLFPNTAYNIRGDGSPTRGTTDTAGVLAFHSSGAGNITVSTLSGAADR